MVSSAVWRTYRWQAPAALPFVLLAVVARPESLLNIGAPTTLLVLAGLIALAHVASYAPRSGLRAGRSPADHDQGRRARGDGRPLRLACMAGSTSATAYTGAVDRGFGGLVVGAVLDGRTAPKSAISGD